MKALSVNETKMVSGGNPLVWAGTAVIAYASYRVGKRQGYNDNVDC
ncbi:MAG: hypothetical protein LAT62_07070 [Natronospirillum sp.]|nr:hypothetical protein [Natronospirillum sp.]MCH8551678.1 hypothetical protein [Natronospirillum sp.]